MSSETISYTDKSSSGKPPTLSISPRTPVKSRRALTSKSKSAKYKRRGKNDPEIYVNSESDSDGPVPHTSRKVNQKSRIVSPPVEKERSGYTTSEESSEYEIVISENIDELMSLQEEEKNAPIPKIEFPEIDIRDCLRRRNVGQHVEESSIIIPQAVAEEPDQNKQVFNESDVSLGTENESSDDFWKFGSLRKQKSEDRAKLIKNSKEKLGNFWRNKSLNLFTLLREWKLFKEERREELLLLKLARNRCFLGLLIGFIFCGIGGIIFRTTEGAFESFYKCGVKRVKRDFLDTLFDKRYLREDEWKSLARTKLMDFENQLYDAYDAGMTSYSGQKGWSFINSVVYCITVVTTIGYGHMAPVTPLGRIATIVYSLFGIPMFLIIMADYGKLFTRGIKFLWAFVRRLYYTGSCRKVRRTVPVKEVMKGMQKVYDISTNMRRPSQFLDKDTNDPNVSVGPPGATMMTTPPPADTPALSTYTIDDNFNLPISVAFSILVLYMFCGALFFSYTEEKWNFFDAFYFVYISISTIGFGDLVPKSQMFLMVISLVYFVFGLSLTSMCINVIQEKLSDSFQQASAKIGATMGLQVSEEGNVVNNPYQMPFSECDDELDNNIQSTDTLQMP